MAEIETVALREELARALWEAPTPGPDGEVYRHCKWSTLLHLASSESEGEDGRENDAQNVTDYRAMADAILPIIARERAAALSAATPVIEARVREECAGIAEARRYHDPAGTAAAIRKG